jgi:hypothetical protein
MKVYYNNPGNTCQLKLHIPLELINNVYKELKQNHEVSGVFYADNNNKVTNVDKNHGDAESVHTPNNVINYHTHPISAYRHGKTSYGWPSGEDFRETLKFALSGNKAHLVFTVEGLYTIQVNPCKIKKIKEILSDTNRGILVFLIEEYFKTTHNFRCIEELENLARKHIDINPYSFIELANTFDLGHILSSNKKTKLSNNKISNVGHTGIHGATNMSKYAQGIPQDFSFTSIPNTGFPSVSGSTITTKSAFSAIDRSEINDNLRSINELGKESNFHKKININELMKELEEIAKLFKTVPCDIQWNTSNPNTWFYVNFFPSNHFVNKHHKKNGKHVMPDPKTDELYLSHEPFIRIFSNQKEGCTVSDIAKKNNFKNPTKFTVKRIASFGKKTTDSFRVLQREIKYLSK